MSLERATNLVVGLFCFALLLQVAEMFLIVRQKSFLKIWSWQNLEGDLAAAIPLPRPALGSIYGELGFKILLGLQGAALIAAAMTPHFFLFFLIFIFQILIGFRFRGVFNGGSDMMTFVVLTGILIIFSGVHPQAPRLGLIYVGIHLFYSYFKAGVIKVASADWRNGSALAAFLNRSVYKNVSEPAQALQQRAGTGFFLGWLVIAFEIAIVLLPFFPRLIIPYMIAALIFHFLNFLSFGLNRFFWIWLAAWPALIFGLTSYR